jgi:hypothetical protein
VIKCLPGKPWVQSREGGREDQRREGREGGREEKKEDSEKNLLNFKNDYYVTTVIKTMWY